VVGYSREVSAWFDENCGHGSDNKMVPWFIIQSPQNIKKSFLEAYILGDGQRRKGKNQVSMCTVSRKLCYDLLALHFDLGIVCYVDESEEGIDSLGIHRKKSYRINYREEIKRENGHGTHKSEKYVYFKVLETKTEIKDTTVYNFTVNKNHNYCANMFFTKNCGGSGKIGSDICEHEGGTLKRIVILNPDYVDIHTPPLNPDPIISLRPDEELINMIQKKMPGYEKLSLEVRKLVSAGQPIRLDNHSVSHLKYGECGYQKYGISMVRRLFPILSYKTKLMVAQWIVAERLIIPIKVVRVGSDERPAGPADIAAVQAQLSETANDPNVTIVTHNAFEIEWVGASGKVLTLSNELEFINQEILDGMMINNALLNGEGPAFASAAVGIESMIQRLTTFRTTITEWLEEYIYIPEAYRQGFIDKNAETGEDEILIPKIKWNSMHLRDQQNYRQSVMQLYEKGLLSAQTVLEVFDFDPDQEIERKRYDALQMAALGKGMGGQDGGGGGMGGGGGGMGGLPPPMGGGAEGGAPIGAPGAEGGEMEGGGAPAGGAPAISKSSSIVAEVADPSQFGGKVLKKRTREQILSEQEQRQNEIVKKQQQQQKRMEDAQGGGTQRDEKGRIIFTKAERDLMPYLLRAKKDGLFGNDGFTTQFRVTAGDSEYLLDFAFPTLKIGVEADGEIFHSSPKQVTHDKERDMLLAQQGWTVLRFTDTEIERSPQQIIQQVIKTVMQKQLTVKNLSQEKR
jgi:very-short-patch-repair endonuclease